MAGIPLSLALLLVFLMAGWFAATWVGGAATGPRVSLAFTADCDLSEPMLARAQAVGFGEIEVSHQASETLLQGRLPGLEDDLIAMPELLSSQGLLRVLPAESAEGPATGEALATQVDLTEVWLQIGMSGHPYVLLVFQPNALTRIQDAEAGALLFELDGEVIDFYDATRSPDDDDLRVQPKLQRTRDEVRLATDWNVILKDPLPCPVRHVAVTEEKG